MPSLPIIIMHEPTSQFHSLFLGDLSYHCKEVDILKAFQVFGEVLEIRLMKKNDGRSLNYGFVTFKELDQALRAIELMNGKVFMGRELHVSWAFKKSDEEYSESKKAHPARHPKDCCLYAEVHFSFCTKKRRENISEATIRPLFEEFGPIQNILLKRINIDPRGGQNGHGFIYYPLDSAGISAAIKASFVICQLEIDEVIYDCALTHLFQQFLKNGGLECAKEPTQLSFCKPSLIDYPSDTDIVTSQSFE